MGPAGVLRGHSATAEGKERPFLADEFEIKKPARPARVAGIDGGRAAEGDATNNSGARRHDRPPPDSSVKDSLHVVKEFAVPVGTNNCVAARQVLRPEPAASAASSAGATRVPRTGASPSLRPSHPPFNRASYSPKGVSLAEQLLGVNSAGRAGGPNRANAPAHGAVRSCDPASELIG